MRLVAQHIENLTRVVLAAELSTRREFQGLDPRSQQAMEIASEWIHRAWDERRMKHDVDDAVVIAETVWWAYMRPHIKKMLVDKWGASVGEAEKAVDQYFVDDSPTYHPERNPRGQSQTQTRSSRDDRVPERYDETVRSKAVTGEGVRDVRSPVHSALHNAEDAGRVPERAVPAGQSEPQLVETNKDKEVKPLRSDLVKYLQYVHNTGGCTIAQFNDDWEPIGPLVLAELMPIYLVEGMTDRKLMLTPEGDRVRVMQEQGQ